MPDHLSTTAILTTPIPTPRSEPVPDPVSDAIARLRRLLDGQLLASQDRCIDGLLDLFNATAGSDPVRRMVADVLDDIRHLSAVRADELSARVDEIEAALAVEAAFAR